MPAFMAANGQFLGFAVARNAAMSSAFRYHLAFSVAIFGWSLEFGRRQ